MIFILYSRLRVEVPREITMQSFSSLTMNMILIVWNLPSGTGLLAPMTTTLIANRFS